MDLTLLYQINLIHTSLYSISTYRQTSVCPQPYWQKRGTLPHSLNNIISNIDQHLCIKLKTKIKFIVRKKKVGCDPTWSLMGHKCGP